MSQPARELKRIAGNLLARLPDLQLEKVEDPRSRQGRRWELRAILRTVVVGICAGCKSIADVELLTARMARGMRRRLGVLRRLPDTTTREILVRLSPFEVRAALHSLVKVAARRKALECDDFPFHVATLDGKGTAFECWDHHFAQQNTREDSHLSYGLVRTITSCLISTRSKPIIDCFPIPAETNEMGIFPHAFEALLRNYKELFQLVTYDAGAPSKENCQTVVDAGKDFFFRVKVESWHAHKEAKRLLGALPLEKAHAITEDVLCKSTQEKVIRRVFIQKAEKFSFLWDTIQSFVRVHVTHMKNGKVTAEENKYYITSLDPSRLTPAQWLKVARGHWGVENNGHWTLDAIFEEDDHPWIEANPRGVVVVMVLRRIAYTMLSLFRSVTQRSDEKRAIPWKRLLTWVCDSLVAITEAQLDGLRQRQGFVALN